MPGGEQGERNATRPPSGRLDRRNRGASALIDAVFPQSESAPAESRNPSGDRPADLLTRAVDEIVQRSGAEYASAWLATKEDGLTRVAAYACSGEPPADDLEPGTFEALRRLVRATDLGDPAEAAAAGRISDASGLTAAVAVGRPSSKEFAPALAVLALGGPEDPLGTVRPKSLALLQEVARQLDAPLTTLATLQHISGLGDAIRWLDRQAALGEMLGEIVHEIRNPLVSVKTFMDLLPNRLDDAEFLTDFRSVVLGEVTRLERLLDTVLQHAQPQRLGDAEPHANVESAMETLRSLLSHRAGESQIQLVCQAEPETRPAALAPDALQQVLLNLTLNALGATPSGGEVRVRAYEPAVAKGHWVELTVEDSGPGIPAEARERVFEPFATGRSDRPGGLGLAISKRLVEEAGGRIEIGEALEGGARVVIRLPGSPTPENY
jgi:signal transduction histidine kinase